MPILADDRHERFAQGLASGLSAIDAYEQAGYARNRSCASRLAANANIAQRAQEIRQRAAKGIEVTVQTLIEEAEDVRAKAIAAGQFGPAIRAITEKGILAGVRVEKRQNTNINPNDLSDDDLAAIATGSGEDAASTSGRSGKPH